MPDSNHLELFEKIAPTIKENAIGVDATGAFPRASIDAFLGSGLAGLISAADIGGSGQGPRAAVEIVEQAAQLCGSTAMIIQMHYAGATVIEKFGQEAVRKDIAAGKHLTTLAFSERGSRSHFWAPQGTAKKVGGGIQLDAHKSWITSASHAHSYVWSSQPLSAEGMSTIWMVPSDSEGIEILGTFDGLGLRGNDSQPAKANGVIIPEDHILGEDGGGLAVMLETVLPIFNAMMGGVGSGFMQAATNATIGHVSKTGYAHLGNELRDLPTIRAYVARMKNKSDAARTLLFDAVTAMETGREDAMLRVLQCKAVCGETATEVTELAMRVCGGMAFRKDVGVERTFRDARAGTVMAPTTDQLYDFIGKALTGMDVF